MHGLYHAGDPSPPSAGLRRKQLKLKLHWQILIAMVLGTIFAALFGEVGWVARLAELFMRTLRMVIVPLIFTSITSGIAGIGDGKSLGRLGIKTLAFYALTSLLAIVVGQISIDRFGGGYVATAAMEQRGYGSAANARFARQWTTLLKKSTRN